jgi:hypothetical protein
MCGHGDNISDIVKQKRLSVLEEKDVENVVASLMEILIQVVNAPDNRFQDREGVVETSAHLLGKRCGSYLQISVKRSASNRLFMKMQISSLLVLAASVSDFDVERSLQMSPFADSVTAVTCVGVSLVRATKVFEAYNYSRFFPTPENCEKVVSELQSEFVEIVAEELQQRFEAGARIDLLNGYNTQKKRKFKADANRVYLTCKNVVAELEDKTVKRETYFFISFESEKVS